MDRATATTKRTTTNKVRNTEKNKRNRSGAVRVSLVTPKSEKPKRKPKKKGKRKTNSYADSDHDLAYLED